MRVCGVFVERVKKADLAEWEQLVSLGEGVWEFFAPFLQFTCKYHIISK